MALSCLTMISAAPLALALYAEMCLSFVPSLMCTSSQASAQRIGSLSETNLPTLPYTFHMFWMYNSARASDVMVVLHLTKTESFVNAQVKMTILLYPPGERDLKGPAKSTCTTSQGEVGGADHWYALVASNSYVWKLDKLDMSLHDFLCQHAC
jgi:hypothetical protein